VRILRGVAEAMTPRAREKNLGFGIELDGPVPERIVTDPTRLHQILLNLVSNAIKFTAHGRVRVAAGLAQPDAGAEPLLRFVVEDTGVGMSSDQLARLFVPFSQADESTTRRFGGTGLGLSICKSLAGMLGGDIAVSSEPGVGSRFSLTVPAGPTEGSDLVCELDDDPRTETLVAPDAEVRLDGQRILVAEDGPDNQRLIERILTRAGASVEIVDNGEAAVERALKAAEVGERFDAILMDMQMPVMDGYQATRSLRERGYAGRIFALTANAMKGDAEKCLAAGCDDFFSKPLARARVLARLGQG
jgi:CheY-like chemotaxis protein